MTSKVDQSANVGVRDRACFWFAANLTAIAAVALSGGLAACSNHPTTGPGGALQGTSGAGTPGPLPTSGAGALAPSVGGAGTPAGSAGIGVDSGRAGTGVAGAGSAGVGVAGSSAGNGTGGTTAGSAAVSGSGGAAGASGASGTAGGGGNQAAACTGKPGQKRGKSKQMVMIGGQQRWYNYYAPSTLDPNTPAPLVLVPHGYFMDADIMYNVTKYSELADKEKFVVAFPSGAGSTILDDPWNIGTNPVPQCIATVGFLPQTQNDDQAFLDAIIKFADADQCIDHNHVFMTGFSMGAYLTNTTGCNREEIKAIAPHSGGSHDFANCKVKNKPVLLMHFQGDELIPYMCGTETRDRWIKLNGCQSADPDVTMVKGGSCEYYKGCAANGQVAMCTFNPTPPQSDEVFKGHGWSGGTEPQPVVVSGYAIPETESATLLSWEFFKKYAW